MSHAKLKKFAKKGKKKKFKNKTNKEKSNMQVHKNLSWKYASPRSCGKYYSNNERYQTCEEYLPITIEIILLVNYLKLNKINWWILNLQNKNK